MRIQFIDEPVEVELSEGVAGRPPVAVTWQKERYPVERVEARWIDAGWGPLRTRSKRWWQRRHRTYYQVKVPGNRIFELYHDRGIEQWILYRILYLEEETTD